MNSATNSNAPYTETINFCGHNARDEHGNKVRNFAPAATCDGATSVDFYLECFGRNAESPAVNPCH